jgi:hypothetical protein
VRVNLADGSTLRYTVNEKPGGVVANPPAVDAQRGIVVGYDTGHGVVTSWRYRSEPAQRLWTIELDHGSHPIVLPVQGLVALMDFDAERGVEDLVLVEIETGREHFRVATGSPVQSVLFGACGFSDDLYLCSFLALTRVAFD